MCNFANNLWLYEELVMIQPGTERVILEMPDFIGKNSAPGSSISNNQSIMATSYEIKRLSEARGNALCS